jgi:hypothetical protein
MVGAADDPVVVITISIGAVLIATLLGIWLKWRNDKKNGGG